MEMLEFCLEVIKREREKFNVDIDYSTAQKINAVTAANINYDIAHNRCAFMYRCGTINLSFAKDCFGKFMSEYKDIFTLLFKWYVDSNLTLCSISKGPALDYLALLLFCYEKATYQPLFKNIKVINRYGAWRNTVNIMQKVISEGYLKCLPASVSIGNIQVIQGDPLLNFCEKTKAPVGSSDVILMVKAVNLQTDSDTKVISKSLQEIFDALKPNAFLFCIDTRPSTALIIGELLKLPGSFLYEPTYMNTVINIEFVEHYKNNLGCSPILSARGSFFVWQKSVLVLSKADISYLNMDKDLKINKILKDMNGMHSNGYFNESSGISNVNHTEESSCISGMPSSFNEIPEKCNELINNSQFDFSEVESNHSSAEYMCTDTLKSSEISLKSNFGYVSPEHFESSKSLTDTCLNPEKISIDVDQTKQLEIRNFSNISSISPNFNEIDKEYSFSKQATIPIPGNLNVSSDSLNSISLCNFTTKKNVILSNKSLGNSHSFIDKCVQTDADLLETKIHTANANNINALKNKILKLTSAVNELIKADQSRKDEKRHVENSAEFCKHSTPKSFHMSCIHKSPRNLYMPSSFISKCCGRKDVDNFDCNYRHDRMSCTHQNVYCATSHNGFQATKHPCASHDDKNFNPNACVSHDGPNLVIPLNNLQSDIILQIISLLSRNDS